MRLAALAFVLTLVVAVSALDCPPESCKEVIRCVDGNLHVTTTCVTYDENCTATDSSNTSIYEGCGSKPQPKAATPHSVVEQSPVQKFLAWLERWF